MPSWPKGTLEDRVRRAIEEVRPGVQADGGDVTLVAIDGDRVQVQLSGACSSCPMASSTLSDFVGERVKLYAPEIAEVVSITTPFRSGGGGRRSGIDP